VLSHVSRFPVPVDKSALRRAARAARDGIAAPARRAAATATAAHIDRELLSSLPAGATVVLYAAKGSEIATDDLAAAALARGLALAYPRIVAGTRRLSFHLAGPGDLRPGTFGIPEPPASAPAIEADWAELVFLPGLAFDRRGVRLGWGQGHYDTTLAGTDVFRVGLAYDSQLVDEIPDDEHDIPVHMIATEVGLHRPG